MIRSSTAPIWSSGRRFILLTWEIGSYPESVKLPAIAIDLPLMQARFVCLGASCGDVLSQLGTPNRYKDEYNKNLICSLMSICDFLRADFSRSIRNLLCYFKILYYFCCMHIKEKKLLFKQFLLWVRNFICALLIFSIDFLV